MLRITSVVWSSCFVALMGEKGCRMRRGTRYCTVSCRKDFNMNSQQFQAHIRIVNCASRLGMRRRELLSLLSGDSTGRLGRSILTEEHQLFTSNAELSRTVTPPLYTQERGSIPNHPRDQPRDQGPGMRRCFKYNQAGHLARECPSGKPNTSNTGSRTAGRGVSRQVTTGEEPYLQGQTSSISVPSQAYQDQLHDVFSHRTRRTTLECVKCVLQQAAVC